MKSSGHRIICGEDFLVAGHDADQRDIERLDSIARSVYADIRLNQQVPIAVVGSGLSVPYGGISWSEAKKQALDEALKQIKKAQEIVEGYVQRNPHSSKESRKLAEIVRARRSIEAFQEKAANGSDELYLAMQIAYDGIKIAHACVEEKDRGKELRDDLKGFMAKLFGKERFRLAREMATRIVGPKDEDHKATIEKCLSRPTDKTFDEILARFYSFEMLERLLPTGKFPRIISQLKKAYKKNALDKLGTLPPDRRSLVALFLAVRRGDDDTFDAAALWKVLKGIEDKGSSCLRPLNDPIREIHEKLGIRRFITLNYDHELERALMFDDVRAMEGAHYGFDDALSDDVLRREPNSANGADFRTAGVKRRFSDGLTASSEIYQASAVANLFEFALNSPDYRIQIVHQHGRADVPDSMVLTDDDLNRVYRHNNYDRTTLEQAQDVILTGNPILFIGLGLTEPEITRPLRQLVGEGRATGDDPAFAIMVFDKSKNDKGYDKDGGVNAWRRQFGLFRQYGIHLFDAGHPRHNQGAFNRKVAALEAFTKAIEPYAKTRAERSAALSSDDRASLGRAIKAYRNVNVAKHIYKEAITNCEKLRLEETVQACRDANVAEDIALDDIAFNWLLNGIENGKISLCPENYYLFKDYLGYLINKHYTQYLIYEIRRLEEHVRTRFAETTYREGKSPKFSAARAVMDDDVREAGQRKFRGRSVRHAVQVVKSPTITDKYKDEQKSANRQIISATKSVVNSIKRRGVTFLVGEMGSGKGTILGRVRKHLDKIKTSQFCYINCSMALEFDSAIFQILRFAHGIAYSEEQAPLKDRLNKLQTALMKGPPHGDHPPLIVISGIESLLDAQSKPLTPELELVIKMLLHPYILMKGWHVLIAGTQSAITWVEHVSIGAPTDTKFGKAGKLLGPRRVLLKEQYGGLLLQIRDYALERGRSDDLTSAIHTWPLYSKTPHVPNGARSPASGMLIGSVLRHWHEIIPLSGKNLGRTRACAELDRQILQNLAYVGQPVARAVLAHMPDIQRALRSLQNSGVKGSDADLIIASCKRLAAAGLAMDVLSFPYEERGKQDSFSRLALPRTVLAELRERAGVRSGEEQLSNSFTLTLAASMPTDLVLPDADVTQTLGEMVGHLRAAWKDGKLDNPAKMKLERLRKLYESSPTELSPLLAEKAGKVERVAQIERLALMAVVPMDEALRAAAAIVRGFFSAATLVSTDPASASWESGVGAQFEQHRKRVDRLLERTREVRRLSKQMEHELSALDPDGQTVDDCLTELIGKSNQQDKARALYSGELIWLLNEAGVIGILQGNLKAADRSLREAENALVRFRGMGARNTWRRLAINQSFVGIERGRIAEARAKLSQLEKAFDEPRLKIHDHELRAESDDEICRPIVTGYLGLVDALGGHFASAMGRYGDAIAGLIGSGQQRALALFYWRRGSLALFMHDKKAARRDLELAISEAESALQIDVAWRAHLTMTELQRESEPAFVATVFREARRYAETMKVPRVQVTALRREAEWRMERDDLTVAAALTTQAMQHATRNGMVLMRISLRTLMGSIMLRQGDASGEFLLQRAIRHADRIGYQQEVNKARNALLGIKVAARR